MKSSIDKKIPSKNIFVIGYNSYHDEILQRIGGEKNYTFHNLVHMDELRGAEELRVEEMLRRAEEQLDAFDKLKDAVISFIDFPAIEMTAILGKKFGLHTPSLESVLRCNHKYWSRILQKEAAPRTVPPFAVFDPYSVEPMKDIPLNFPYWIKPVNSYNSYLGFRINNEDDLNTAIPIIREEFPRLSEPFDFIMRQADLPGDIRKLGPQVYIAESIITGFQCTLEGYVFQGEPAVYGVIDSIREANRTSFSRYQYPSKLPKHIQKRMKKIAIKIMKHIGFDNGTFNIEFFYDSEHDRIWLLEINPRLSQSHCELFEKVDGRSHHRVTIDIALGKEPDIPRRKGKFKMAAKYFVRAFSDATVVNIPVKDTIDKVRKEIPDLSLQILVDEGELLSHLKEQDSYSYELAWLWIGGNSDRELHEKHEKAMEMLGFEISAARLTQL